MTYLEKLHCWNPHVHDYAYMYLFSVFFLPKSKFLNLKYLIKRFRKSPIMLFGYYSATTAFKNQICSNYGFFRVFHTLDFAFFGLKIAKSLQEMPEKWWKYKKFTNFSNMFETPQECILDILEPLQPSKNQIFSNLSFFKGFPYTEFCRFWLFLV